MSPVFEDPFRWDDCCGECDRLLDECSCDDPDAGGCPDCGRPRDYCCCDDGPGYGCPSCEGTIHFPEDGPGYGRGHLSGCPLFQAAMQDPES